MIPIYKLGLRLTCLKSTFTQKEYLRKHSFILVQIDWQCFKFKINRVNNIDKCIFVNVWLMRKRITVFATLYSDFDTMSFYIFEINTFINDWITKWNGQMIIWSFVAKIVLRSMLTQISVQIVLNRKRQHLELNTNSQSWHNFYWIFNSCIQHISYKLKLIYFEWIYIKMRQNSKKERSKIIIRNYSV